MKIDEKVRMLTMLFKDFLDSEKMKDSRILTSYAIVNMTVHFLIENGYLCSLHDYTILNFKPEYIECSFYLRHEKNSV